MRGALIVFALLVVWFLSLRVDGLVWPKNHPRELEARRLQDGPNAPYPAMWFTQYLDHFNPEDNRTFQQRYYVNSDHYDKKSGIVFLYINGEGPAFGPPYQKDDEVVLLAQKYNALIATLEHRYYGKSTPFAQLTTENLQYLSSKQALFDLALFITNITTNMKVFTIGGSYSGALSAWFRLKYPHITAGSISSSGVVNAILDFTTFDQQVALSAGVACANAMRMVTSLVEAAVVQGGAAKQNMKQMFMASSLVDDGDFMYFLADSMAEGVQYGYQDSICVPLLAAIQNNQSVLPPYVNYTLNVWGKSMGSPEEYSTAWQQNITADEMKADRQWWFQTCTEFGYFQNAPATDSIRSAKYVNMNYFKTHCQSVYGQALWPNTAQTNEYYGGATPAATKVYFVNGSQDPWQRASVIGSNLPPLEPSTIITCHNCGHCVDLGGCPGGCQSPNNFQTTRDEISKTVGMWLQD